MSTKSRENGYIITDGVREILRDLIAYAAYDGYAWGDTSLEEIEQVKHELHIEE